MAIDSEVSSSDPQIVGNAFVEKYYNLLYETPENVHKFYLEDSVLGRPGSNGEMVSVKSLSAVNEQIMSFDIKNSRIQILTADSQGSYKNGVIVLVTGLLTGKDGLSKKFSQSFFLTPQKGSYFVLNDVFRYVSEESVKPTEKVEETPKVETVNSAPEPEKKIAEPASVPNKTVDVPVEKVEDAEPIATIKHSEVKPVTENKSEKQAIEVEKPQQDAPKKSFASIVQSLAQKPAVFVPKAAPKKTKPAETPRPVAVPKAPEPVVENSSATTAEKTSVEGGSIFVANLPMEATEEQLHETFKQFGAIKPHGIQVRSYKLERNCFGFVSFESASSVKEVLQATKESPIKIGDRRVSIEEKRGGSDNGRASGRGGGYRNGNGYRNGGFRGGRGNAGGFEGGRGNAGGFGGGRGSGRNGYERRNENQNGRGGRVAPVQAQAQDQN